MSKELKRCGWVKLNDPLYVEYHDKEWGKPLHGDRELFALLALETQQAGLSWQTILHKREAYRREFFDFDMKRCAALSDEEIEAILARGEVIKNRAKLRAMRSNAKAALEVVAEFGSLDHYFWSRVDFAPQRQSISDYRLAPTRNELSDSLAKDMKKRGFKFVGSVTIYAFLQAAGIFNDHEDECAFK